MSPAKQGMAVSKTEIFIDLSSELLWGGYGVRFRPKGASMYPAIRDGEAVTVEPVEPSGVRRGDIILYKTGSGSVIAHRVVEVNKSGGKIGSFILRGDASETCDLPITPGQILGRVVSVERGGRDLDLAGRRARLLRNVRLCASRIKARAYSAPESKE